MPEQECPICHSGTIADRSGRIVDDGCRFACPRCGTFDLTPLAIADVVPQLGNDRVKMAAVSHVIRRMVDKGHGFPPRIDSARLRSIIATANLPTIAEVADNLVLLLGQEDNKGYWIAESTSLQAQIGTATHDRAVLVINALSAKGLLQIRTDPQARPIEDLDLRFRSFELGLTYGGWQRFEDLQRSVVQSKRAFMAMKFNDEQMDSIFARHFVPAIRATGYELRRSTDGQKAGLIDDMMRVDIRTSRFVIADLTHANNGAYWEAGFGEGLGRPVIYTCRKDVFDDPTGRPHFDTNHHVTVIWDPDDMPTAVQKLKDTVRATLPEEAKLED
jgi:hypothetical protein